MKFLPSFKTTCFLIGGMDMFLASTMILGGVMNKMAEFKIPEEQLNSPHYSDAMFWVFLHMFMIGIFIILIGYHAQDPAKKLWTARILVLIHLVYAFLDFRTSDTFLGNGLYQGPGSVVPAIIDVVYILLFLRFCFKEETLSRAKVGVG